MKHINLFFCSLILFAPLNCFAQFDNLNQKAAETIKTEIGINITNLLSAIIDLTENAAPEEPFDFVLKRVKANQAVRLHFGIAGNRSRDDNNLDQTNFSTIVNLKLGKEWRKNLNKHFDLFYGFDFSLGYRINRISSERSNGDELNFREQNVQLGPNIFIGGMFHIHKNLYVSTQAGFDFLYENNRQRTKDERIMVSDKVDKLNGFEFNTHVPKSLFLFFKF